MVWLYVAGGAFLALLGVAVVAVMTAEPEPEPEKEPELCGCDPRAASRVELELMILLTQFEQCSKSGRSFRYRNPASDTWYELTVRELANMKGV